MMLRLVGLLTPWFWPGLTICAIWTAHYCHFVPFTTGHLVGLSSGWPLLTSRVWHFAEQWEITPTAFTRASGGPWKALVKGFCVDSHASTVADSAWRLLDNVNVSRASPENAWPSSTSLCHLKNLQKLSLTDVVDIKDKSVGRVK